MHWLTMQEEDIQLELNCSANQLVVEDGKAVIKMAEGQEKRADLLVFDADQQKYTEI